MTTRDHFTTPQAGTDKVRNHNYQTFYTKYFELGWPGSAGLRYQVHKLLEIGLGCDMNYGPGRSAYIWRAYFPSAKIWFAERDGECVMKHKDKLASMNISTVTGDQSSIKTLNKWVDEMGGNFDVIIDDGGHRNHDIYNSFLVLFTRAVKPGGL